MKIYISGKMTGLSKWQIFRNFNRAEKKLVKHGYSVLNPAVTFFNRYTKEFTYNDWLQLDFKMIDLCDAVCFMDNWKESNGARLELEYAQKTGKTILFLKFFRA